VDAVVDRFYRLSAAGQAPPFVTHPLSWLGWGARSLSQAPSLTRIARPAESLLSVIIKCQCCALTLFWAAGLPGEPHLRGRQHGPPAPHAEVLRLWGSRGEAVQRQVDGGSAQAPAPNLTDAHFERRCRDLQESLRHFKVSHEHVAQIMAVVETTRNDVLGRDAAPEAAAPVQARLLSPRALLALRPLIQRSRLPASPQFSCQGRCDDWVPCAVACLGPRCYGSGLNLWGTFKCRAWNSSLACASCEWLQYRRISWYIDIKMYIQNKELIWWTEVVLSKYS